MTATEQEPQFKTRGHWTPVYNPTGAARQKSGLAPAVTALDQGETDYTHEILEDNLAEPRLPIRKCNVSRRSLG